MLQLFILLVCHHLVQSAIDSNCTEVDSTGVLRLAPSAIKHCVNLYPFEECRQMFGAGTANTARTTTAADIGRAAVCYQVGATPSEDLKRAAIANCPLYCGFCCVTPAVNCPNAPAPRLDCNTITDDMCDSILWRELIAEDCPGACGFCLLGGCIDAAPDCVTQPTICGNTAMAEFTQVNCRRTCNLCDTNSTTTNPCVAVTDNVDSTSSPCADTSSMCSLWNRNGFCSSTYYTTAQKSDYCAATCNLCTAGITIAASSGSININAASSTCSDNSSDCSLWNRHGFCSNAFYTDDQKRDFCAATCNLC